MAKNMPKIAEVELTSSGIQKKTVTADLRLQSNISLKSCVIATAEVLPSSCGIGIAELTKS
jgi:hypothetical protein